MGSAVGLGVGLPFAGGGSLPSLDLSLISGALDSRVVHSRSSNATMLDSRGRLVWAPANAQAASSDFNNPTYWNKSNLTAVNTGKADPFGGTSACALVANATSNSHAATGVISCAVPGGTGAIFVHSAYVKAGRCGYAMLSCSGAYSYEKFDIINGTWVRSISSASAIATGVENVGNGWFRIWAAWTSLAVNVLPQIYSHPDSTAATTYLGDGTSEEIYVYGQQLEGYDAAAPKTLIPTTTAARYLPRIEAKLDEAPTWTYSSTELITDPGCNNAGAWNAGAGWSVSGGKLVCSSASNTGIEQTAVAFTPGKWYRLRFDWCISAASSDIKVYKGQGSQLLTTLTAAVGSGSVDLLFRCESVGTSKLLFQASVTAVVGWIDNVSLVEATPTYPYAGLLIEGAATNLITYSEGVSSSSNNSGVTVASGANNILNHPNARRLTGDGTSAAHYAGPVGITPAGATQYTVSVYVRPVGQATRAQLLTGAGWLAAANAYINVNFASKAITAVGASASNAFMYDCGGGTFRIGFTFTTDAVPSAAGAFLGLITSDTANRLPTNTSTDALDFVGFQLEAGAVATSYVPTFGATATRSAETAYVPTAGWLNTARGTMLLEVLKGASVVSTYFLEGASGTTPGYGGSFGTNGTSGDSARVVMRNGSVRGDSQPATKLYRGRRYAQASVWGAAAVTHSLDGATTTNTATPGQVDWADRVYLGGRSNSSGYALGHIRRLTVWPYALDQATLNRATLAAVRNVSPVSDWNFLTRSFDDFKKEGLVFSRAGNAMHFDSQGRLVWAQANLIGRSDSMLDSAIFTLGNATVTSYASPPSGLKMAVKLAEDNASAVHFVSGSVNSGLAAVGEVVAVSVYLKAAERDRAFVNITGAAFSSATNCVGLNLLTGVVTESVGPVSNIKVASAGDGWWRLSFEVTVLAVGIMSIRCNTSQDGVWANRIFTGTTGYGVYVSSPQVERAGVDSPKPYIASGILGATYAPRIDYDPVTLSALGLLMELASTNGIRNNAMIGASAPSTLPTNWAWYTPATGLTSTVEGVGVEDGIPYIDIRLVGTAVHASPYFAIYFDATNAIAAAVGQVWTASAFIRLVGGSFANLTARQLVCWEYNSVPAFLGSSAGSVSPTTAALRTQRLRYVHTMAQATSAFVRTGLQFSMNNGASVDFTVRIGLPQLEQLPHFTSPIVTVGAAATRAGETYTQAGASDFSRWWRQDEGTFVVEVERPATAISDGVAAHIDDGTTNERHVIGSGASGDALSPYTIDGGVAQSGINQGAGTGLGQRKLAYCFAANDFDSALGGSQPGTPDATGTLPIADRIRLGNNSAGSGQWGGWIKRVRFFNTRLPIELMKELTR